MDTEFSHAIVVDDHPDALEWLANSLTSAFPGIQVATATTLDEGFSACKLQLPDIALIDLGLPDGSGIDLLVWLHATAPNTLKIVSSIFSDDRHLFDALRAGAQGYVLKDESLEELVAMLRGITAGQPPLSRSVATRILTHFHRTVDEDQPKLTPRETEVLTLLAQGYAVKRVASRLNLTPSTTATYVKHIYQKLNVRNRAAATLEAGRRGLVDID